MLSTFKIKSRETIDPSLKLTQPGGIENFIRWSDFWENEPISFEEFFARWELVGSPWVKMNLAVSAWMAVGQVEHLNSVRWQSAVGQI